VTSGTRSFFELFNTIGRLRRDAAWALEAPRYLLELIRVWVQKYEAGAFDEDAATADLLQEYEARTDAGYRNFYSDLNLAAAHALKGDIDQAKAPLGARFNERVEQAAGRRPQTAERLFLRPVRLANADSMTRLRPSWPTARSLSRISESAERNSRSGEICG